MANRRQATCMDKAIPALPDDILRANIFTRLDVKSLLRFRSVCKSWNSIIREPDFIKNHLYCTSQNPNDDNLIFTKDINEKDYSGKIITAILTSSDLLETSLMQVPYSKFRHAEIDMIGSINGLVCQFHRPLNQFEFIIIWNPATRQAMKINSPSEIGTVSFFGFCWDAMENDFKVVISYYNNCYSPLTLYVYSCNSGSWSSPRDSALPNMMWPANAVPSTIVVGVPYWTYSWYAHGIQRLVKFDVESKDFRVLPELYPSENGYVRLVNLNDCLSALVYGVYYYDKLVEVHCFDERSGFWSKMHSVGPISGLKCCCWGQRNRGLRLRKCNDLPINDQAVLSCFNNGGEIVFSANGISRCYNHKINKVTDLQNQKGYISQCFSYKASLIFLEGMKPQHLVEPTLWN